MERTGIVRRLFYLAGWRMNLVNIAAAIHARLTGDNGPGGLFNTTDGLLYDADRAGPSRFRRNYTTDIESTVASGLPVVVWRLGASNQGRPTFESDEIELLVNFDIYGKPPQRVGDTGDVDILTIAERIFGDSSSQVGGIPTYGLHKFAPDSSSWSGWTPASGFWWISGETAYDEKVLSTSLVFRFTYGRSRPLT